MTAIIPDMDATRPACVDPTKIFEAIENFGVTNMFGSPALLNRVGRYGRERGVHLPTLKRVISAGAPVPARVLSSFGGLLREEVEIFTPYGATEALPVCSIGSRQVLAETAPKTAAGAGVCVGRPVEGIHLEIIRIDDAPITNWTDDLRVKSAEIGEIAVTGPVVTRNYYRREASTVLAKIEDPGGQRFFHRMGDLGYLDETGRVWFCGRKAHRVITRETTLFTIPCEGVFNVHDRVHRTALVGVPDGDGYHKPVLCVETEKREGAAARETIRGELLALGAAYPHTRVVRDILFHDSFPVDIRHNAKIFREKLALWAAGQRT
jgi:acyl-coenzyme A synthetase/AMP-(fatty) acid ligase